MEIKHIGKKRGGGEQHNKKTIKDTKNTERKHEKWMETKKHGNKTHKNRIFIYF
jgi:hypothetical protein